MCHLTILPRHMFKKKFCECHTDVTPTDVTRMIKKEFAGRMMMLINFDDDVEGRDDES